MDVSAFPLGRRTDAPTRQRRQKDSKYPQEATRFSKGDAADNVVSKAALPRADISTVALGFSPSFGSSPVSLALANSKVATAALAGPSHNSAVRGSIRNRHTSGSVGPPGHHTSSVFRQTTSVLAALRMTLAR